MLERADWAGLIEALDNGLPANLESQGDVPLFEHVLFAFEDKARRPGQVDVPQAPVELLEAFLRNGLNKEGCYRGQATHVSVAVNYGQWAWAHRLLQEGFVVEQPQQSALVAMTAGRLHRALAKGMAQVDPQEGEATVGTLAPDPLVGSNVHAFPSAKARSNQPPEPQSSAEEAAISYGQRGSSILFEDSDEEQSRINDMVAALIASGARLDVRTPLQDMLGAKESKSHFPPLMHAIYHLDEGMVSAMVAAGADLHARPSDLPYRPLEMAISRGSASLVQRLIDAGAPVGLDPSYEGQAQLLVHPLVLCVRLGLEHLVDTVARAMPQEQVSEFGEVAMHVAAAQGNVSGMRAVRQLGIAYDVSTQGNGFKPIHQAAFTGNEESLAFLLRRGQRWDATSNSGLTPQDILASNHPHMMARFGLSLPSNVRTLFGRKPGPR